MRNAVETKEIKHLWHFTDLDNAESILNRGLVTRENLERQNLPFEFNDELRIDGVLNSVSCSISHPNYKMFYPLRMDNPDKEWIVIALNISILWEKECAFCRSNAASADVLRTPLPFRMGEQAFEGLYDEYPGAPSRAQLGITNGCPTNPQAEVLVLEDIHPQYFDGVVTQTARTAEYLKQRFPNFTILYHRALFQPRGDYEHWR